jgi:hypothetical protein
MSSELIAWLRLRLDEDEQAAMALEGATVFMGRKPDFYGVGGPAAEAFWDHFTSHRMLDEVRAKRQILDHLPLMASITAGYVLPLLAMPYADRPGFREEWRA